MAGEQSAKKVIWVHPHIPWSPWTNSGASRSFCLEMRKRGLLHGALGPDIVSRLYARNPGLGFDLMCRIQKRLVNLLPAPGYWKTEEEGALGSWLRTVPPGTPVVYFFNMPEPSVRFKLRRCLVLNLSAMDARKTGTFGYDAGMSDEEFKKICEHQRRMLSWADGVVTPSTYAADSISRDFGYPREKMLAVGYGPALEIGEIRSEESRFSAANILFVGRDWERKGGPLVYNAWKILRDTIPHAQLTIVGPSKPPVDGEGVHFVGYLDKTTPQGRRRLQDEYMKASVFCMPTLCEPWGLVYSEAAAMGCPIVSFRTWSLPDIVEDGVTGRLVDRQDEHGLAEALQDVLSNPSAAKSMGEKAMQRMKVSLSWSACTDRLLSMAMPGLISEKEIISLRKNA